MQIDIEHVYTKLFRCIYIIIDCIDLLIKVSVLDFVITCPDCYCDFDGGQPVWLLFIPTINPKIS